MGRIKKAATERHMATLSPFVEDFVKRATEVPLHQLPSHLSNFPQHWPLPRGDLYHWIPLLDRIDHVLEIFNQEYALDEGPQIQPFESRVLLVGDAEEGMPYPSGGSSIQELSSLGYAEEGDRELVEALLHFTRILLEHCGNRSLYASSTHISNLLHTTSLSLLRLCLKLSLRLAQRYQVARYKNHHPSAQAVLLANHYNLNLDNMHKLAMPFPKTYNSSPVLTHTPSKGKEKITPGVAFNPSDLVSIAKEPMPQNILAELSNVNLTYYEQPSSSSEASKPSQSIEDSPSTPTPSPNRRPSNLGPLRDRHSDNDKAAGSTETRTIPKSQDFEAVSSNAPKLFHIPASKVVEMPAWSLVKESLPHVPSDMRYDLLNRIRISKAFATPDVTSQMLLETRLLAIANLAYALPETKFQEKIGLPDAEEPRRFHLASQLCDLLQPSTANQTPLSLQSEATVIMTLEGLTKSRHKVSEVADGLAITVNHGIIYYELRKVIATLSSEEHSDKQAELRESEWRDATFDLVNSLLQSNTQARYGEKMVSAGIMAILVEALKLRTTRAERFYERVLQFFDSFVHGIPTAFQTLAGVKGLDIIADLTAFQVDAALESSQKSSGLPTERKSKVVDYDIPFYNQSTLRQLFKNTVHMFEHNAGTHDRLLRNLIDTPQILGALKKVIVNAHIFGSNVWSGAVNIVSSFIHNEPTSYQVIGEAGLSRGFLESIIGAKLPEDLPSLDDLAAVQHAEKLEASDGGEPNFPSVDGILPVGEVMCDIPTAFGAICLNESGMHLFQASSALFKYFDIFLSPIHVRAMEDESQTATTIGHSFDELSRHHPRLKDQIMAAVFNMLKRLRDLCEIFAVNQQSGAKLWHRVDGKLSIAGNRGAPEGKSSMEAERSSSPSKGSDSEVLVSSTDGLSHEDAFERAPAVPYLTACFKFLEGFFHNSTMCSLFCDESGAEIVLDLASSPSVPYDLVAFPLFSKITQALKSMCESKPHLVLPSIIWRTQRSIIGLKGFTKSRSSVGSFSRYIELTESAEPPASDAIDGTSLLKDLVNTHLLTHVLGRALAPPAYTLRHGSQNNHVFTNLNFTEIYLQLIDDLSKLHASCVWEALFLMRDMSDQQRADSEPRPFVMRRIDANGVVELATDKSADASRNTAGKADDAKHVDHQEAILSQKNLKAIRYLLSQVPMGIESFFHSLGQAIVTKRMESSSKQHAVLVADRLAQALLWELEFRRNESSDDVLGNKYIAGMLTMVGRMLLRNSYSMEAFGTKEALTLVLNKFYQAGGFAKVNEYLERFVRLSSNQQEDTMDGHIKDALQSVLNFYDQLVRSKCINDATQSNFITVRDKSQPDYFQPGQILVEVRNAVLPAIGKIWQSKDIEQLSDANMKSIVDILRLILKAEGEERALRRSERASRRVWAHPPEFKLSNTDGLDRLVNVLHFDRPLSCEALYRCNNTTNPAEAYCRLRVNHPSVPRFPIPEGEAVHTGAESSKTQSAPESSRHREDVDMSSTAEDQDSMEVAEGNASVPTEAALLDPESDDRVMLENEMGSDDEDVSMGSLGRLHADLQAEDLTAISDRRTVDVLTAVQSGQTSKDTQELFVTIDDLDEKRDSLRDDLIDRCLDVLSVQPSLTFELSDLIQAAVAKAGEGANPRADIGTTLVSSLMSLQAEDPSKEAGMKIHAYAHLVALILQDRDFFDSTLDELKECFENLVRWVKLEPDQKIEDAPWIDTVLLIVERILAEDEQPVQIAWEPPPAEDPLKSIPLPPLPDPVVPQELRSQLFDALVDLLPKIGKNSNLALYVSRVLVILTRRRELAARLSDKHTIQRLFLMIRQLAGSVDDKLQSTFMLILRHIIEDDNTIRQIMRGEIKVAFDNYRSSRAMETTSYTRNLHHLVLRSPTLFVEVTDEMLEIIRFEGNPHRAQSLALKKPKNPPNSTIPSSSDPAPENVATEAAKTPDVKQPPVVESPDGVIQFLLRELSNYRDVEDKALLSPHSSRVDKPSAESSSDVQMHDSPGNLSNNGDSSARNDKLVFKPEEHTIYIYRCFLLQCLAELLACYNKTKVEFINFSRKPETQPPTPSKPRAGTLNYLLNVLLPVGTLEHRDDVAHRKKVATSGWATSVLASLCTKTQERRPSNAHSVDTTEFAEQEPELTFVRKFVLEHALRSFKDATGSSEPLDQRYSRLLVLGELFNRMLNDKVDVQRPNVLAAGNLNSHQQMGRLMYEKNFIGTLTSAIAELDLNFPNAKRAVKYILAPLKLLTELGVSLTQTSDLSSFAGVGTGTDEEDELSSNTSNDDDDEREQTPDLFRGSSLGILEGGARDDDEFDSDDEGDEEDDDEMYDEGYEEEMDFEDDQVAEHGDVVSDDDDDELDGMGPIEGLPGDVEIEVDMTIDDGDEDDSDNEDDDDDDDDDMSDGDDDDPEQDAEFGIQMEEVTGDDENASMGEQDEERDWEDDGMDYEAMVPALDDGSPHDGPLERLAHVLGAEDPSDLGDHDGLVRIDMGGREEEEFFEDEMPPEDDDEEEEGDLGEDIVYEPEMEDDEDEDPGAGWAWDIRPPPGAVVHHHHHHHHHHRGFNEMLGMLGGDPLRAGHFRTHRSPPNARDEDGMNPLLQREGNNNAHGRDRDVLDIPRLANRRAFLPRHGESVLQDLVAAVGAPGGHGVINVNVEPGAMPGLGALPSMFTVQNGPGGAMIDLDPRRPWREQVGLTRWPDMTAGGRLTDRVSGNVGSSEAQAVDFRPTATSHRWQEEARLLFPGKFHEKASRVINMLFYAMVPAAMEANRIREKEEAERRAAEQKAAEEARKKLEAEKAERDAQEKKEREEREAREREEAEARAREEAERAIAESSTQSEATGMDGIEQGPKVGTEASEAVASASDEAPSERVMITLRGREIDITTLGIDREYIEALPEELREDVVMAQLAEQRQQQVDSGERPSEISREFLDALPREIQQELLRSEQMERRRRERDEARRRAAQEGAAAQPEEMNNADFMAMLDPSLRQAVLMDADEAVLASLPEDLQAEARALFGDRRAPRGDQTGRGGRGLEFATGRGPGGPVDENRESNRTRRPVPQMLDKAGVATLLRLMFVSLNHKSKTHLHSILSDVCKNTQNRAEVISILLSILQDGTADVNAVERSFAHLSLRAKQPSAPKTPQPIRRTLTGQGAVTPSTDLSPLNIVQQCLGTLNALANDNSRVQSFFLNEHETITSQKAKSAKKGKAKENKAVKFPLNALLALLDRKLITENTAVMETLASLLSHVTRPLTLLIRRAREAQEAEKAAAEAKQESEAAKEDRPTTSTSDVPMQEASAEGSSGVAEASAEAVEKAPETATENSAEAPVPEEAKKKHRDLSPPDVPDENIRLVVNILAARECPSRTFSDTLDIIKNLSAIPGAKEVFGKELIRQAQELGNALLIDLNELANQIHAAQTGTEVQGMALASFSSAGSKQRKLLRVLVALDHLFDPKRTPTVESATAPNSGVDQKLKEDVLATLYESSTFDKLWHGLSACLTAIRQRGNMVNVATILLPLIESLMVVCRNSALKEGPAALTSPVDVKSVASPEARMDILFFNFTEEHRKILNELIRNNPKLMNGNLSVLAKNSKVLEFDNKRNYFSRKLHDRRSEVRVAHPSLQLSVRRDEVFLDSFKSLYYKSGNEIKYGKLNIRFHGEEGIDAGGVSREWFGAMARQMFNPDYALFNPVASDRTTFHPNSLSEVNPEHLMFFKFIGRIIGKALYENRVLDCHFTRAVYRKILGKSVSLKDMETLDLDYYKSLVWILENDITDVTFETFSVDVDSFGVIETIDLIPNGHDIAVTEENKQDYVRHVVDFRLIKSVQAQLDKFLEGFHEIIPSELVSIFNEQELELLISGLPDIDAEDWKNNTDYHNYQPTSPQIQWFWRAVRSFDKEEKAKLLQFVTGTSKVPLNGFKELEGMNGFAKFNIHRDYSSKEKLPSSHTCFNQLDLPEYDSYETLRRQLYTAITAGSEYFGFA